MRKSSLNKLPNGTCFNNKYTKLLDIAVGNAWNINRREPISYARL